MCNFIEKNENIANGTCTRCRIMCRGQLYMKWGHIFSYQTRFFISAFFVCLHSELILMSLVCRIVCSKRFFSEAQKTCPLQFFIFYLPCSFLRPFVHLSINYCSQRVCCTKECEATVTKCIVPEVEWKLFVLTLSLSVMHLMQLHWFISCIKQ